MRTNETVVVSVNWRGAVIAVNGENRLAAWDDLRAASQQDDARLRRIYGDLFASAKKMAEAEKSLEVVAVNASGSSDDLGARTWEARLHDMAGEFVAGRIIGADWGLTGTRSYALRDVAEARQKLASMGYDLR